MWIQIDSADWSLIQASGELLEACKFVFTRCRDDGLDVVDGPYDAEFLHAQAAIAKAEGQG